MTVALFETCAVLSRASTGEPPEAELAVARLAARRLLFDFDRTAAEWETPDDALVERVADQATGLG